MKLRLFTIALVLPLSFCATIQRDVSKNVSEVDESISASDPGMNDPTINVTTRVLFRDPGLRK